MRGVGTRGARQRWRGAVGDVGTRETAGASEKRAERRKGKAQAEQLTGFSRSGATDTGVGEPESGDGGPRTGRQLLTSVHTCTTPEPYKQGNA